ncbi:COG4626 Phage terminase-like protein, large subunit [uncultured Caudovirales phage]|uniref:COG4626 Phage terminase-like protein, large subunit n=1 Tax=uncultured Caudovirales phage TaxID=2100421 RepID=A0A6J5MQ59_9CAUD|nr:COG4626 Phage terminase-like protein, large subunit [uncultured Caudovirales phage]
MNKQSDGDLVTQFASEWLTTSKGVRAGEPLVFTEWQRWLLNALLERRTDGRLRNRRALIGLPRKQGKSLLGSTLALYGLFAGEAGAEVYSAAGDRQQARIVFNEAKQQIQNSPMLSAECNVYRDAIEVRRFGAVYRVLSSDGKLQQGLNPSMVVFDELHVQHNDDLWDALTLGSGARLDPITIGITTAGFDLETLCGRLYQYGKSVAAQEIVDDNFGFYWWEANKDCDINNVAQWNKANPNLVLGLIDAEDMQVSARQTSEMAFRRYRLNQWVRSQESWLPVGAWENMVGDATINTDDECYVGIDMALKHDSIAIVIAQPQENGKVHVEAKIWHPDMEGIDIAEVEQHLRMLHLKYEVREFAYDPAYFQRSAESLMDDGLPMVEFPQSSQRMIPACGNAYDMIAAGRLVHSGSPMFTDQVLSAAQRMTENGWRLSKGKSRRKIDAAIAMCMALDRATRRSIITPAPTVASVW